MTKHKVKKWTNGCLRKKKYTELNFAKKVANKVKEERGQDISVYMCPDCLNYHLTSNMIGNGKYKSLYKTTELQVNL